MPAPAQLQHCRRSTRDGELAGAALTIQLVPEGHRRRSLKSLEHAPSPHRARDDDGRHRPRPLGALVRAVFITTALETVLNRGMCKKPLGIMTPARPIGTKRKRSPLA